VRRFVPVECERLQGFPDGWTLPLEDSKFYRVDDLDSLRYHAVGNAVTVPVVEWIARRVDAYLSRCANEQSSRTGDESGVAARNALSVR
jgi:DNA (cytosine-5)-methyltransferase 1